MDYLRNFTKPGVNLHHNDINKILAEEMLNGDTNNETSQSVTLSQDAITRHQLKEKYSEHTLGKLSNCGKKKFNQERNSDIGSNISNDLRSKMFTQDIKLFGSEATELPTDESANGKVIELRSLYVNNEPAPTVQNVKRCNCMKTNTHCSHKCSDAYNAVTKPDTNKNTYECTKRSHTSKDKPEIMNIPPVAPYYPVYYYPPGEVFMTATELPYKVTYYQPQEHDHFKHTTKHKRYKTTKKESYQDIYYSDDDSDDEQQGKNKQYDTVEDYLENDKSLQSSTSKIEILVDEEEDNKDKEKFNVCFHGKQNEDMSTQDKRKNARLLSQIENYIGNNLKDVAVKKCYCSSAHKISDGFIRYLSCFTFLITQFLI